MDDFLGKNLQALIQAEPRHGNLRGILAAAGELTEDEYEFYETEDGNFTIKYRGVFLHDMKAPRDEALQAFQQQCRPEFDNLHLILGIGLGYALETALSHSRGKVMVYEPDVRFLRFVLENIDLSVHFASGRVWLATDRFETISMLEKRIYGDHQLDMLVLKSYAYLMSDEIPGLMPEILEVAGNYVQDFTTGEHFHFKWIRQFLGNYDGFSWTPGTDALVNRFPGKPAIVVSRGPSLDGALEAIRDLAGSAVLIAVGGAIRHLWKAGITPDFGLFYDANGMAEQLHGIPQDVLSKITFILSPFTQRLTYECPSYGKMVFMSENNGPFARFLDGALRHNHHKLEGGGTVSLIGYQLAQAMACSPIALVGQDLSMPNNKVYAGGTELQVDEKGRMALPRTEEMYTEPEGMTWTPGQDGEAIRTLKCYVSYIQHFEQLAVKNERQEKPAEIYNCSPGGALIQGFPVKALAEFVGQWPAWRTPNADAAPKPGAEKPSQEPFVPAYPHVLEQSPDIQPAEVSTRKQLLREALQGLRPGIQYLQKLMDIASLPEVIDGEGMDVWPDSQSQARAQEKLGEAYLFLKKNPFLEYVLLFELLGYKRAFRASGGAGNGNGEVDLPALRRLFTNGQQILQNLSEWLDEADARLSPDVEHAPPKTIQFVHPAPSVQSGL